MDERLAMQQQLLAMQASAGGGQLGQGQMQQTLGYYLKLQQEQQARGLQPGMPQGMPQGMRPMQQPVPPQAQPSADQASRIQFMLQQQFMQQNGGVGGRPVMPPPQQQQQQSAQARALASLLQQQQQQQQYQQTGSGADSTAWLNAAMQRALTSGQLTIQNGKPVMVQNSQQQLQQQHQQQQMMLQQQLQQQQLLQQQQQQQQQQQVQQQLLQKLQAAQKEAQAQAQQAQQAHMLKRIHAVLAASQQSGNGIQRPQMQQQMRSNGMGIPVSNCSNTVQQQQQQQLLLLQQQQMLQQQQISQQQSAQQQQQQQMPTLPSQNQAQGNSQTQMQQAQAQAQARFRQNMAALAHLTPAQLQAVSSNPALAQPLLQARAVAAAAAGSSAGGTPTARPEAGSMDGRRSAGSVDLSPNSSSPGSPPAQAMSREQRRMALACVAVQLVHSGISVDQAIHSGVMGGMSVTDVHFIVEVYNAEQSRLRSGGVRSSNGGGDPESVASAAAATVAAATAARSQLQGIHGHGSSRAASPALSSVAGSDTGSARGGGVDIGMWHSMPQLQQQQQQQGHAVANAVGSAPTVGALPQMGCSAGSEGTRVGGSLPGQAGGSRGTSVAGGGGGGANSAAAALTDVAPLDAFDAFTYGFFGGDGAELIGELELGGDGPERGDSGATGGGLEENSAHNADWMAGAVDIGGLGNAAVDDEDIPKKDDLESRLANLDLGSGFF